MAATVTGAFIVLDRASRPIRRIRDEALEADAAVKSLGSSLDKIGTRDQRNMMGTTASQIRSLGGEAETAGQDTEQLAKRLEHAGSPQIARNITTNASSIRNTGRAARETEAPLRRVGDGLRRVGSESDRSGGALRRFAGNALGLRQAMMLMLIPAIGLASTGISALGAGVVELLPNLTRLSGLAAPAGTAVMGVGLAAITAKLAFSDLGKAMGGNAKAMKALTPEAKQFLTTIRQYQPVLKELRQSAQRGLFPGLDSALRQMNKGVPVARSMLNSMGRRLGNLASDAAGQMTTPKFLRDFETIGNEAGRTVTALGHGLLNLMQAFRHFLVAGLPFTHWLTDTTLGWTKHIEQMAEAGRESGRLSNWFIHVQQSLTTLGHIAHNVFSLFTGVLKAASGESDYLYGSIEKTTGRWAAWAQSAHGQNDMRQYFASMRQPLHEVAGLVGDLVKGIASMVDAPTFTNSIQTLRQAVPGLAAGLGSISRDFGPVLVNALSAVVGLFSTLAGHGGPVSTMLTTMTGILTTFNSLLHLVPGLGAVMSVAFAVLGTQAMMQRFSFLDRLTGKLSGLAGSWRGVGVAARGAMAEEMAAASVPVGGGMPGIGRPGVGGRPGAPSVVPPGMEALAANTRGAVTRGAVPAGMEALAANLAMAERGPLSRFGARIGGSRAVGALRGLGGRAGQSLLRPFGMAEGPGLFTGSRAAAGRALGGAARFMAPIAAFQMLAGAAGTQGNALQRLEGGAQSLTFGLASGPITGSDYSKQGVQRGQGWMQQHLARTYNANDTAGMTRRTSALRGEIAAQQRRISSGSTSTWQHGLLFGKADTREVQGRIAALKAELANENKAIDAARQQAIARAKVGGQQLAMGFGEAFNIYSRKYGPAKGMKETGNDVVKQMAKLGPVGRMSLATSMTQWAREQARMNPKLAGQAHDLQQQIAATLDRLGQHVKIVNGRILTGSTTQWQNIATAMTSPAEKAREAVSASFTALQQQAVGALTMMGYTRAQATQLIQGSESGGVSTDAKGNIVRSSTFAKAQMHGFNPNARPHAKKGARGMRIGGTGLQDNVMIAPGHIAAPGELVVNRHTEQRVKNRYGVDLGREVAGETRPHWQPMRPQDAGAPLNAMVQGGIWPGLTRGGRINYYSLGDRMGHETAGGVLRGSGTSPGNRLQAMIAEANAIDQKHFAYEWGGGHNGAFQPGHGTGHGSGKGIGYDCSGSVSAVLHAAGLLDAPMTSGQFMAWGAPGPGEVTLYANPSHVYMAMNGHYFGTSGANPGGGAGWFPGGPRPGFAVRHAPGIGRGAARGIDWSAIGGLGGGGRAGAGGSGPAALMAALHAPNSGLGGVPGALAQAGMNAIAAGMTQQVNRRIGAAGGPGGGTGGLTGGTSGANQTLGRRMMLQHGWGPGQWPALKALWNRESGWNQNARNPSSGAYGIPQALGHGNVFGSNPAAQIRWGLDYIAGRYGSPSGAWAHEQSAGWYEKGGRLPGWGGWFGQGGRARYRRPTMIGVGDAHVPEEVTVRQVRPTAGDNQTGGKQVIVNFHPGAIVVHGASREAAEELADHVISRITTVLGGMGHESEGDVN